MEAPFATLARKCRTIRHLKIGGSILTDKALHSLSELLLHEFIVKNPDSFTWQGLLSFTERVGYFREVYTDEMFLSFADIGVRLYQGWDEIRLAPVGVHNT